MEQKVKKRTWVKDAAIVFLAIMLVLTFFSNTILNRTLPEAATALVEPNSIDSKVRISGTVSAKENYDVILDQSRKVASVAVKVGQEVATGDVLFTLEPGDSDELTAAKRELHSLELQYQKAVINADNNDYSRENRNIELAKAAVDRAQAKYDNYALTVEEVNDLEKKIDAAEAEVKSLQNQVDAAQTGMQNSSDGSGYSGGGATTAQRNRLAAAENALKAAKLAYQAPYELLEAAAKARILVDKGASEWSNSYSDLLPYYMELLADSYKNSADAGEKEQYTAYVAISAAQAEKDAAQEAVDSANESGYYDDGYTTYQGKSHSYWVKEYNKLKPQLDDAQAILDKYKDQKTNYETALTELDGAEEQLRNLQDALEDAKKNDRLEALDRQELQNQIADAKAEIEKLSGGSDEAVDVKAKVNGTVQSLSVSAGHTANAGEVLATIEVPDLGYTMNATVTNEQARLLHVGDTAKVSNFYWGAATTAEITAIRPDPKNPQSGKLVMFDITGDVAAGSTLNFSIGEKNANYDYVVPNSAVRSDSTGSFILIITAKNSPLGNRYYATRVDVEVVASDEYNSAIKGAVEGYESVITTTSNNAPVANGDQVRLADVNN